MINFPDIDPIALSIGPLSIRWYALAYMIGFLLGWWLILKLGKFKEADQTPPSIAQLDNLLPFVILGVILGGRLGYVLFYNFEYYSQHLGEALMVWHGGMSFHGGLIGVITTLIIYAKVNKIPFFSLSDCVACVVPIGLFFGRIANFVNAELYGHTTDLPWGVLFPGEDLPRHPSQLYEAILEGAVLFTVLILMYRKHFIRSRFGVISGTFLMGYGISRFLVEYVREPDAQIGLIFNFISMGQILSLPMIIAGGCIIMYALTRAKAHDKAD